MFRDLWNFTFKYAYWYWSPWVGKVSDMIARGELISLLNTGEGCSGICLSESSTYGVVNIISNEVSYSNQPSPFAPNPEAHPGVRQRNIVDLLCNFKVFDAIIHPSKYTTSFPSGFQKPYFMPTSPRESILSMIPTDAFRHRESILSLIPRDIFKPSIIIDDKVLYYDTPYSTMPFLSSELETIIYCRKEFVRYSLLPELISEVTSQNTFQEFWVRNANKELNVRIEQWRTLTRVLDVLAANRHPWFGDFYDVVTEYYGPSYRKFELIDKYLKEWYELEDLMAHQSRLLQEGGYLDSSSDESEASYSSGSESNSSD